MLLFTHTLANGATVASLSAHGFKFSDGTECRGQDTEVVEFFTLKRKLTLMGIVKDMHLNEIKMELSEDQLKKLKEVSKQADLIIIPFPMLSALREQGVRNQFPNCVSFNSTPEPLRSPPNEKIVDINNWSY